MGQGMKKDFKPQEFFVAGGTLWGEAPSYITRPVDEELLNLTLAGEYCNILAARQMGKSSLMVRTAIALKQAGVRTAIIDISTLGGGISTPGEWFYGFLDELSVQLDLDTKVNDWWESHAAQNAVQRFSNFLRDVVLVEITSPITLFIDEIDSALGMAFTDDFFAAIRAAYNARASSPEFQRLTIVLIGVARPADLIRDRGRTPYNIGTHISLRDFILPELLPFQTVFETAYPGQGADIVQWVLDWTNGQPYLTQKLCAALIPPANQPSVSNFPPSPETIAETVHRLFFTDEARKESNLRAIRDRIESSPHKITMLQVYDRILRGKPVLDEERSPAKNELKLTGIVRPTINEKLEIRNRIYRKVFDRQWVRKNLPQSRTRQFAILMTLLAILAFIVAGVALYQQRLQSTRTFEDQFTASNSPEVKLTSLARLLALNQDSAARAHELYAELSHEEKRRLFTELSSPQNVAPELVILIEAVYQENENTPQENQLLNDMGEVLGQIGAAGAPGLKTELEFWLTGREEGERQNYATAISFYDRAWTESENRDHPNFNVRFDRAMALIETEQYALAMDDLQAVWEQNPARQGEIAAVINAIPALAYYGNQNAGQYPALIAFITPVPPTPTPTPSPTFTPTPQPTSLAVPTTTEVIAPTAAITEEPSPFAGWITYAYGIDTGREIFIMNPVTGFQRQITSNGVIDEAPSFSPDNWSLVYASNRSQGGWELYTYDLQKSTEEQLTSFTGQVRFPVWSPVPEDMRILFEGRQFEPDEKTNIWMLDTRTGIREQLTSGGADSRPGWSPDGTQIVFGRATLDTSGDGRITTSDNQDIYTLDLASRTEKNLTNTLTYDDFNSTWSPDGEQIAFTSVRRDANGDGIQNLSDSRDLFTISVDGSEERQLDLTGNDDQAVDFTLFSPSWAPDGRTLLVLAIFEEGQNEIWEFNPDRGTINALTERGPYFQPSYANAAMAPSIFLPPNLDLYDLAFASDRDGAFGVYLMNTENLDQWQILARPVGFERTWWPTFCQSYIAYEAQDIDGLQPQWIYLAQSEKVEPVKYPSSLNAARFGVPRCSPDGNQMAFSVYLPTEFDGWMIGLNDFQNNEETALTQNPSFGNVTWSNLDNFFLSMTTIDGEFFVLQTSNLQSSMILTTLAKGKYPALSPNGNQFIYLCSNQSYLCLQNVSDNEFKLVHEVVSISLAGESVPATAMWSGDALWIYFASAADGDWDIYRVRPDGSELQNLTAAWDSNELMPALNWQP
jgi:Tol biopolymer transport system component